MYIFSIFILIVTIHQDDVKEMFTLFFHDLDRVVHTLFRV